MYLDRRLMAVQRNEIKQGEKMKCGKQSLSNIVTRRAVLLEIVHNYYLGCDQHTTATERNLTLFISTKKHASILSTLTFLCHWKIFLTNLTINNSTIKPKEKSGWYVHLTYSLNFYLAVFLNFNHCIFPNGQSGENTWIFISAWKTTKISPFCSFWVCYLLWPSYLKENRATIIMSLTELLLEWFCLTPLQI